jgi:uroporphyrinogen III methyltransferase / synthase
VDAYRTIFATSLPREARDALRRGEVDGVTFTSASTVRGFVSARGARVIRGASGRPPKIVCIGPVTAAAARDAGLRPAAVAKPHTIEGLIAAIDRALPS